MAADAQLDSAGAPRASPLKIRPAIFLLLLALPVASRAQNACRSSAELQKFTDQSEWSRILAATGQCRAESADNAYYRGLAFAGLERWTEAQAALAAGEKKYPQDKRFPEELAGVAFRQRRFPKAERHLHRALELD